MRSSPLTARATCTLPTVIPLPRGPASSKALSRPSNKWSWDIDDAKFSPLRGRVGANAVDDAASDRIKGVFILFLSGYVVFVGGVR